jgi:hypothetical protein
MIRRFEANLGKILARPHCQQTSQAWWLATTVTATAVVPGTIMSPSTTVVPVSWEIATARRIGVQC